MQGVCNNVVQVQQVQLVVEEQQQECIQSVKTCGTKERQRPPGTSSAEVRNLQARCVQCRG